MRSPICLRRLRPAMRLLLDTHLLVLAIGSPERLPAALGPARWPAADHGRPATGGLPGADAAAAKPVAGRDASHCSAGSLALDLAVPPFQPSFPASHRSGTARPSGAPDPATGPSARAHPQGTGGRDHPAQLHGGRSGSAPAPSTGVQLNPAGLPALPLEKKCLGREARFCRATQPDLPATGNNPGDHHDLPGSPSLHPNGGWTLLWPPSRSAAARA